MEKISETLKSVRDSKKIHPLFFNRLFIGISMFVIGFALAVNVVTVQSDDQRERARVLAASDGASLNIPLPPLPKGCTYNTSGEGRLVDCSNAVPTNFLKEGIIKDIPLPSLPKGCTYKSNDDGSQSIDCSNILPTHFILGGNREDYRRIPTGFVRPIRIPPNCRYEETADGGYIIKCATPSGMPQINISRIPTGFVRLLPHPSRCKYESSDGGYVVKCPMPTGLPTMHPIPLPTLPEGCMYEEAPEGILLKCTITIPPLPTISIPPEIIISLPPLPDNCKYENTTDGLTVKCEPKTQNPQMTIEPTYDTSPTLTVEPSAQTAQADDSQKGRGGNFLKNLFRPFIKFFGGLFGK